MSRPALRNSPSRAYTDWDGKMMVNTSIRHPITDEVLFRGKKLFTPEARQKHSAGRMDRTLAIWALHEGQSSTSPRWDCDPTYFAPGNKGNQLREFRPIQQGRKGVRGKSLPTTSDLLDLL